MKNGKTAVIIGSGIGGITTAIYLARQGYAVTVFEKNASPGGRCGQILRDGHRFDLGATILLMPEIYRQVFSSLGLSLEECFDMKPLTTLYKIHFGDGSTLSFTTDHAELAGQLESFEKGSYGKAQHLIRQGYDLFCLAAENLLGRNFYRLWDFINVRNGLLLMKLKTYVRHVTLIRKYFKNPNLQKAFTFQNIYVGQNPNTAPALFSMLPAAELTEGSMFLVGGMYSITLKLVSLAEESGVVFRFNTPVERIQIEGTRAAGVVLQDGLSFRADVVVANADLPYVYRELLPDKAKSRRIDRLEHTCSAIVLHWGLDKTYFQLSHHNVFLSADYDSNLSMIFREHSLSGNPSFYIHAPARSDPEAAPAGHDSFSVIIPCGYLDDRENQDWNDLKNKARESVIARLKKAGLEDIDDHIKFEISYLPQTWKGAFNLSRGSTFGSLAHSILQMGYFRPHNRHSRYTNLYFTGGSTHPGNGIPFVLLSAKLTSERILKESRHE